MTRAGPAPAVDLEAIRARLATDGATITGRRPIGLRSLHIGPDALDELASAVGTALASADHAGGAAGDGSGGIVVLVDATPMRRGPTDLKADAVHRLRAAFGPDQVRAAVIGRDRPELHADAAALAEADAALAGAAVAVSIGSGTITDIVKDASFRAGIPFVAVQTAVSVNAFSDDMAVLLRDGVKRTVPSHWPDALIVDLQVIADAPAVMNRAGFGELTAMFTAPADWYLATAVGADDSYDPDVVALFRDRGERLLAHARGVARADHGSLAELAAQMTLTGIAMGVAGRTAPLSGTEHTISHLLDMAAERDGRRTAFHGAQVGVAAVIVSLAWRRVLRDLDPARLGTPGSGDGTDDGHDTDTDVVDATRRARVAAAFDRLDPSGAATAECWTDYRRKARRWDAAIDRRTALAVGWATYRTAIGRLVLAPESIVEGLRAAGAPTRFSELDPPIPPDVARWAVASCHLMRDRFTVADLVDLSGALGRPWDEALADDLLAEAAALGGGL